MTKPGDGRFASRKAVLSEQLSDGAVGSALRPQFRDDFLGGEQVLELLVSGQTLMRTRLREALGVKNERLGAVLDALERAGRIRRTPAGWQRID